LRLAVVHGYSTHDLLLRYWLAANGVDPDRDVDITVLPPAEVVGSLAAEAIDGFCAGAPWGQVAEHAGLGFVAVQSRNIWRDHPEKCLALRADFAARDPAGMMGLLRALIAAGAACAAADAQAALAALLAAPAYLDLPAHLIAGGLNPDEGGPLFEPQYPWPAHAEWFAGQLLRWAKAPPRILDVAAALYRPDLFTAAGGVSAVERAEVFCSG
jgi:NitT/TauT family transport system ATP-binding protein/nitrate/nitrite transport system substrate-binding protein